MELIIFKVCNVSWYMWSIINYAIYKTFITSWDKVVNFLNIQFLNKHIIGLLDLIIRHSYIFESIIHPPISTTNNYKIYRVDNMITALHTIP